MGADLTTADLRVIADKVDKLDELDLDVAVLRVSGHDVHLRRLKGARSHIIGITSKQQGVRGIND